MAGRASICLAKPRGGQIPAKSSQPANQLFQLHHGTEKYLGIRLDVRVFPEPATLASG
jgi:hypothetical protein